jgi:hypothetical protein
MCHTCTQPRGGGIPLKGPCTHRHKVNGSTADDGIRVVSCNAVKQRMKSTMSLPSRKPANQYSQLTLGRCGRQGVSRTEHNMQCTSVHAPACSGHPKTCARRLQRGSRGHVYLSARHDVTRLSADEMCKRLSTHRAIAELKSTVDIPQK